MEELIRRRIAAQPKGLFAQSMIALLCVAGGTLARLLLAIWVPLGIPYITHFPALFIAAVLGGLPAGIICLFVATVSGMLFFIEPMALPPPTSAWTSMAAFLASGGAIVWLCDLLATSLRDLDTANRQERLLVMELQHRVKNTLAIVQAIAAQTLRTAPDLASFRVAFTDRLIALSRAHNLLSESGWTDVALDALAGRVLEPFVASGGGRIQADGDDLRLPAELVVDVALCLHELGSNATKHGALSKPSGKVTLNWRRVPNGRAELVWFETGGPTVEPPTRTGFGSRILERGLTRGAHPDVTTEYRPQGLYWRAEFDAP